MVLQRCGRIHGNGVHDDGRAGHEGKDGRSIPANHEMPDDELRHWQLAREVTLRQCHGGDCFCFRSLPGFRFRCEPRPFSCMHMPRLRAITATALVCRHATRAVVCTDTRATSYHHKLQDTTDDLKKIHGSVWTGVYGIVLSLGFSAREDFSGCVAVVSPRN